MSHPPIYGVLIAIIFMLLGAGLLPACYIYILTRTATIPSRKPSGFHVALGVLLPTMPNLSSHEVTRIAANYHVPANNLSLSSCLGRTQWTGPMAVQSNKKPSSINHSLCEILTCAMMSKLVYWSNSAQSRQTKKRHCPDARSLEVVTPISVLSETISSLD